MPLLNKKDAVGMMAPLMLGHCKEHQLCHSSELFAVAPFHLPLISFPTDTMLLGLIYQTMEIFHQSFSTFTFITFVVPAIRIFIAN